VKSPNTLYTQELDFARVTCSNEEELMSLLTVEEKAFRDGENRTAKITGAKKSEAVNTAVV
jgi:hypothetical protein